GPVAQAVPGIEGFAGVGDLDYVPGPKVVVEPRGIGRRDVDAAVRHISVALVAHAPRRGVHIDAVVGDAHRLGDYLDVVPGITAGRTLDLQGAGQGGPHLHRVVLLGDDMNAAARAVVVKDARNV